MGRMAAAAAVLTAAVVGLAGCGSHSAKPRGLASAEQAVTAFLVAINAGSAKAAQAVSCSAFDDQARQAATSGADPGISFSTGKVAVAGAGATAQLQETLNVAGQQQKMTYTLVLAEKSGLWLVCGRQ